MAEWLRSGLQNRLPQFNSGRGLHNLAKVRLGTSTLSQQRSPQTTGTTRVPACRICARSASAQGEGRWNYGSPITLSLLAFSILKVARGRRHTGRKLVPGRVANLAMGFCRFDYRASPQKIEMTPIRQVNVAPSAGDWSKQLYLHVGAGSRRHHLQGGLQQPS